ncbi:MAG: calcium-binding protein [Spirosomataceae bacterium]
MHETSLDKAIIRTKERTHWIFYHTDYQQDSYSKSIKTCLPPKKSAIRRFADAIDYEIIVDAYDEYEMSSGWHCTFDETLVFPFFATAQLKMKGGIVELKRLEIVGLHSDAEGFTDKDFQLLMEQGGYLAPINYCKLSDIEADEETLELFQIWDFWVNEY